MGAFAKLQEREIRKATNGTFDVDFEIDVTLKRPA